MDEPTWERRSFSFAKTPIIIKSRLDWKRIGILLLIGVVLIAASWKLSADIRLESEKRLHTEEAIAGALNKQYLAVAKFKEEREQAAKDREFNRFLYGTSSPPPEVIQQRIEEDLRKLAERKEEKENKDDN